MNVLAQDDHTVSSGDELVVCIFTNSCNRAWVEECSWNWYVFTSKVLRDGSGEVRAGWLNMSSKGENLVDECTAVQ